MIDPLGRNVVISTVKRSRRVAKMRAVLGGARQVARKVGMGLFPNRLADRILLRPLELDPVRSETILIAPPTASTPKFSGGNIGDRAMIEAFLDNVGGPVRLIVTAVEGPPLPARFAVQRYRELLVGPARSSHPGPVE